MDATAAARDLYYAVKPLLPRRLQVALRRARSRAIRRRARDWPVWPAAGAAPRDWPGWPGGRRFALVLTHDVEGPRGVARSERLAELEAGRGLRSAFAFVPERYDTPAALRRRLQGRGFEVMVHGLLHDGKLFRDRRTFEARASRIDEVLRDWDARGFAAPAAHHDLAWISELAIDHDVSSYHLDPFEPQPCGLGRLFPFWVGPPQAPGEGYVELPYTLPQDFTLFVLLEERTSELWRRGLDWIAERGGMALLKTHPDYMAFGGDDRGPERYPVERYLELLDHAQGFHGDDVWVALPCEVAAYWRSLAGWGGIGGGTIGSHATFCPACREAHARGWLREYPDIRPTAAPGPPARLAAGASDAPPGAATDAPRESTSR